MKKLGLAMAALGTALMMTSANARDLEEAGSAYSSEAQEITSDDGVISRSTNSVESDSMDNEQGDEALRQYYESMQYGTLCSWC